MRLHGPQVQFHPSLIPVRPSLQPSVDTLGSAIGSSQVRPVRWIPFFGQEMGLNAAFSRARWCFTGSGRFALFGIFDAHFGNTGCREPVGSPQSQAVLEPSARQPGAVEGLPLGEPGIGTSRPRPRSIRKPFFSSPPNDTALAGLGKCLGSPRDSSGLVLPAVGTRWTRSIPPGQPSRSFLGRTRHPVGTVRGKPRETARGSKPPGPFHQTSTTLRGRPRPCDWPRPGRSSRPR